MEETGRWWGGSCGDAAWLAEQTRCGSRANRVGLPCDWSARNVIPSSKMNFLVRRLRGRRRAQGWPPGPAPRDKPPGRSIRAIDPNYLSVLSNLEMVERATPSTRRTVPPATTLLSKFLREGDTVAASAAGISGDPRAPAALTSMAAWSFSTWLTLALMTVAFLVARTPNSVAYEGEGTRRRKMTKGRRAEGQRLERRDACFALDRGGGGGGAVRRSGGVGGAAFRGGRTTCAVDLAPSLRSRESGARSLARSSWSHAINGMSTPRSSPPVPAPSRVSRLVSPSVRVLSRHRAKELLCSCCFGCCCCVLPLWAVLLAGRAQATDLVAAALAFILITLAFIVLLS